MRQVINACIQGASHKKNNMACQDNCRIETLENGYSIIAVADGHGSKTSPFSKQGSQIAVDTFCDILKDFLSRNNDNSFICSYLSREGDISLAMKIEKEWKERILQIAKAENPGVMENSAENNALYIKYGTTLLGVVISDELIFSFQLGDGDITVVDNENVQFLVEPDKILGVETHSLAQKGAWKKAKSNLVVRDNPFQKDFLIIVSTDGFSNSFVTQSEYNYACREYYRNIKENGLEAVNQALSTWLDETSQFGSGDDITVVLIYEDNFETSQKSGAETTENDSNNYAGSVSDPRKNEETDLSINSDMTDKNTEEEMESNESEKCNKMEPLSCEE